MCVKVGLDCTMLYIHSFGEWNPAISLILMEWSHASFSQYNEISLSSEIPLIVWRVQCRMDLWWHKRYFAETIDPEVSHYVCHGIRLPQAHAVTFMSSYLIRMMVRALLFSSVSAAEFMSAGSARVMNIMPTTPTPALTGDREGLKENSFLFLGHEVKLMYHFLLVKNTRHGICFNETCVAFLLSNFKSHLVPAMFTAHTCMPVIVQLCTQRLNKNASVHRKDRIWPFADPFLSQKCGIKNWHNVFFFSI